MSCLHHTCVTPTLAQVVSWVCHPILTPCTCAFLSELLDFSFYLSPHFLVFFLSFLSIIHLHPHTIPSSRSVGARAFLGHADMPTWHSSQRNRNSMRYHLDLWIYRVSILYSCLLQTVLGHGTLWLWSHQCVQVKPKIQKGIRRHLRLKLHLLTTRSCWQRGRQQLVPYL